MTITIIKRVFQFRCFCCFIQIKKFTLYSNKLSNRVVHLIKRLGLVVGIFVDAEKMCGAVAGDKGGIAAVRRHVDIVDAAVRLVVGPADVRGKVLVHTCGASVDKPNGIILLARSHQQQLAIVVEPQ